MRTTSGFMKVSVIVACSSFKAEIFASAVESRSTFARIAPDINLNSVSYSIILALRNVIYKLIQIKKS